MLVIPDLSYSNVMMKNYDESVKINSNQNWSNIPDHPYKILIIGGFGSCKTNVTEFNKT